MADRLCMACGRPVDSSSATEELCSNCRAKRVAAVPMTTDSTHEARIVPGEASAIERVRQFITDFYAPWGSWKTAWWEGEVSDDAAFSADNALKHVATMLAATPSAPPADLEAESRELLDRADTLLDRLLEQLAGDADREETLDFISGQLRALSARQIALPPSVEAAAIVERLRTVARIQRNIVGGSNDAQVCEDAAALITRLSGGEVERLREALEPFAAIAKEMDAFDPEYPDGLRLSDSDWAYRITLGDCRAARTALQGESRD